MHWDQQQVLDAFANATSVSQLELRDSPADSVYAVCQALLTKTSAHTQRLFPQLTGLSFEGVDFGCPHEDCDGEESPVYCLADVLAHREVFGDTRLETLLVESCSVADTYIEEWADYVPELIWDGRTGRAHDHDPDAEEDEDEDEKLMAVDDDDLD